MCLFAFNMRWRAESALETLSEDLWSVLTGEINELKEELHPQLPAEFWHTCVHKHAPRHSSRDAIKRR